MSDVVKFQRTSELDAYVVYGVLYRCKDRFIYIGHTMRFNVRKSEHYNLCSGARRVATLFAQQAFQPREEVFDIVVLWQGNCSLLQAKAVEQAFMDKYNTRVYPRPSNGVTVDIDLMQPCVDPMQLNIDMACKDVSSMEWANRTLAAYTAVVQCLPRSEQTMLKQCLEIQALHFDEIAAVTAVAMLRGLVCKYEMSTEKVGVTAVHIDLNSITTAAQPEDGNELRDALRAQMMWFNADKRGVDYEFSSQGIAAVFRMLLATCSPPDATVTVRATPQTPSETLRELAGRVSEMCKPAAGELVTLKALVETMRRLTDGVHWRGIGGPDNFDNVERSPFAKTFRGAFEHATSLVFVRLQGGAAMRRGCGASGWHLYNMTLSSIVDTPTDAARSSTVQPPVDDDDDDDDSE